MGKLKALFEDQKPVTEVFLDFENAKPSEKEKEIHSSVAAVLDKGPKILEKLDRYKGCEDEIRKAITSPSPETEEIAWNAVLPAVDQLQEFYDFSIELGNCFPKLLVALCKYEDAKENGSQNPQAIAKQLQDQQALAKQLADVFDFVLRFDDAKMVNPAIQNDFSYYRRTLNRWKATKKDGAPDIKIRDELANRMSLYFAYPTPMMNVLSQTTVKFLSSQSEVPKENVTTALATMASVCQEMVANKKFGESSHFYLFCLRSMTGAIILYDHISETGAFAKGSPINVRECIGVLKKDNSGSPATDGLLNALRFTTIHLNDAETPNSIKKLLS